VPRTPPTSTPVSLTFDNGPDPGVTPYVLDALKRRDIKATFFVVGRNLERHRDLAERAYEEGHWIGNHTYSHAKPFGLQDDRTAIDEIDRTQRLIGDLAHPDRLFRPMGGGGKLDENLFSEAALSKLEHDRYSVVLWDRLPRDWEDPDGWVETALRQAGKVIVLHDTDTGAMDHLERFLDSGLTFRRDLAPCMPIRRGTRVRPLDGLIA
jgi:peptidoglycan/xylan/chitin deacetylase (PgdA/CDA1 family)